MYERAEMPEGKSEASSRVSRVTSVTPQREWSGGTGVPVTADRIGALQSQVGNRAVAAIVAQRKIEQAVTEDAGSPDPVALLDAAKSSQGEPLKGAELQRAQSFYQNDRLSAVRIHTGPVAQRAVEAFGAKALTFDTHIMLSRAAERDPKTIGHELSHAHMNTIGAVETGREQGHGTPVTEPGQPSELQADRDGAAWEAGESQAPSVVV